MNYKISVLIICAITITSVIGCGPRRKIKERERRSDGVCEEKCSYSFCQGGNAKEGGVQLNFNRTCEDYCVWKNGIPKSGKSRYPGECVSYVHPGDSYIDCYACKQPIAGESKALISNKDFNCYGQSMSSSFQAREEYCTEPKVSNIKNSERKAWININMGDNHFLSKIRFRPGLRIADNESSQHKINLTYSDGSVQEIEVGKESTKSINIIPPKKTTSIEIDGITSDTFEEGGSGLGFSTIELFEATGKCCEGLDVNVATNTEIDKLASGKYYYDQDYQGYPVYRQEVNSDSDSSPLFLFYHKDRWVMEPNVGQVSSTDGKQLWGVLRFKGPYVCPSAVGRRWMYYSDSNGVVDTIDEKITVSCISK